MSVFALLFFFFSVCFSENIVLVPNNTHATGAPVGLIYLTGASIKNYQYVPLLTAVQQTFLQPLYVGIPDFKIDDPSLDEFLILLPIILQEMMEYGLPENSCVFMGGHSLGGAVLQEFSGIYENNYTSIYPNWIFVGQILNAAFITRRWRDNNTNRVSSNYTVSTLTTGGELDGNLYISRIIEQYYIQLIYNASNDEFYDNKTLLHYPVILINGMSHMEYASGSIPDNVLYTDLIPEINYTEAHTIVSDYIGCWMNLIMNNNRCSFNEIYSGIMNSYILAKPFINAMILEGYYWFKKPCNCDPLLCKSTEYCNAGSIWSNLYPQRIMCGFDNDNSLSLNVINYDSFHPTYEVNPIHYANIWNSGNCINGTCKYLNTSTVTQNKYHLKDYKDIGSVPTSAFEMRHKMKSRESCYYAINKTIPQEDFNICSKINEYSINYALQNAPKQTLQRYSFYGQELRTGNDFQVLLGGGPGWTYSHLKYKTECDNTTHRYYMSVHSEYIYTPIHCLFVPEECGVHYCKVLSPAYVMEWLYTDGLRFNLSLLNLYQPKNITC